ncbi:hypothetical protein [Vibrio vulnificus]|uniref:hypothetical protein n=1 Tax=Vibrio vulnificus TaxID=672 RepID=UPI0032421561|nr:hypothetical protein [Vibrio navarrensis]
MDDYLVSLIFVNALVGLVVFSIFFFLHSEVYKYLYGFMELIPRLFVSLGILKLVVAAIDRSVIVSSGSYVLGASLLMSFGVAIHLARVMREKRCSKNINQ